MVTQEDGGVLLSRASATFRVKRTTEIEPEDHLLYLLKVIPLHSVAKRPPLMFHNSLPGRLAVEALPSSQDNLE